MIYLDTNATAAMKPAVRATMHEAMERHGNPSSVHRYGRIARRYLEDARAAVAALVGVKSTNVIFTSGGTESNNLVLGQFPHHLVSAVEHDSVLTFATPTSRLPVSSDGTVDQVRAAERFQAAPPGTLVSVMMVNNETGVIQPIKQIAALAHRYGLKIHCDAVQGAGRIPIDFASLGVDALTLSAHKIGGPQGSGALIVADDLILMPSIKGGGQEMRRRAGTENVPGIIGFGVAAQLAADDLRDMPRQAMLRDHLQRSLVEVGAGDAVVIGDHAQRVANTLSVALVGISAETQVAAMDLAGIAVSAGSACSSGKVKASHVLSAMGYGADIAGSALRISLGWQTTSQDIERCIDAWRELYLRTRTSHKTKAA